MIEFFRDGGWSMFVIVLFGGIALATATFYAARPGDGARHEGFLKWMALAIVASVVAGVASDLGAVFKYTAQIKDDSERSRTTAEGLAESMSPLVMGFAILGIVAFLTAIGRRRRDGKRA